MKIFLYILILNISFVNCLFSQSSISWVRRFGGTTWDRPYVIKTDNLGSIYITGTVGLTSNHDKSPLIKYNTAGDSIWSRIFYPPDNYSTESNSLLLDDSLNIYTTGRYILKYNHSGDLIFFSYFGCSTERSTFDQDKNIVCVGQNVIQPYGLAMLKCTRNGDSLWKKVFTQFRIAGVNGIITDKQNNIIFTGRIANVSTDMDFLTIKFDPNGNVLWSKTYHGGDPTNGYDEPCGVLLDSLDNIVVSGRSNGPLGGSNYYTVKYDPNGNVIWEDRINDGGGSGSWDMTKDKDDYIYISGLTNLNKYSALKYSSTGQLQWQRTVNGTGSSSVAVIALDSARNVYMACNAENSMSYTQYQIVKYNSEGVLQWDILYSGNPIYFYYVYGIAVDNIGNVFVTGEAQFANNSYDIVTIKIDQVTGIIQNISESPKSYSLSQNYPNPFNPITKIDYSIQQSGLVSIQIYDAVGRLVDNLINEFKEPGNYSVTFNASTYSSGLYYYTINSKGFTNTKKMVLIK